MKSLPILMLPIKVALKGDLKKMIGCNRCLMGTNRKEMILRLFLPVAAYKAPALFLVPLVISNKKSNVPVASFFL